MDDNRNCWSNQLLGQWQEQINLIVDKLQILDGGQISSVLYDYLGYGAFGRGTDVNIQAGEIVVSGYVEDPRFEDSHFGNPSHSIYMSSGVDARVIGPEASGMGGNISIITDLLKLTDRGNVATALYSDAPGDAGDININATAIEITDIGKIYAGFISRNRQLRQYCYCCREHEHYRYRQ